MHRFLTRANEPKIPGVARAQQARPRDYLPLSKHDAAAYWRKLGCVARPPCSYQRIGRNILGDTEFWRTINGRYQIREGGNIDSAVCKMHARYKARRERNSSLWIDQ
jgi:hypothetical protein